MDKNKKKARKKQPMKWCEHRPSAPKKKKNSRAHVAGYIVGSMALTAGAAVVIPRLMEKLSGKVYDASVEKPIIDDDYEPIIVKREKAAEELKEESKEADSEEK